MEHWTKYGIPSSNIDEYFVRGNDRGGEKKEKEGREGEWKSLSSELDRYGEQYERSALNKAELSLKDGVVGNDE